MTQHDPNRRSSAPIVPPEHLHERIRSRISATRASTLRTRTRIVAAIGIAAALCLVVVLAASELVYRRVATGLDVDAAHSIQLQWTVSLLVLLTALSTLLVLWRGRRGFGAGIVGLSLTVALTAPVYAALTLLDPIHQDSVVPGGVTISPWGTRCATISAIVGIGVMVAFAAALRHAVPVASRLRGAALGAAAGAWAGLAVFAFCPSGDRSHVLVGHLLPVLVLLLIGALMTPRHLRP